MSKHNLKCTSKDNNGRIAINLGYWNEEKHFEWVEKNPSKIPRPKGSRK
jgi:hypothetical protein